MFPGFVCSAPVRTVRANEVHLWQVGVNEILRNNCFNRLASFLSNEERSRVDAYRSRSRQQLFVIGRGTLRLILSALLPGIAPESIRFITSAHGKPALENSTSQLQFNLSHSHDTIIIAITRGRAIGVDVEFMKTRSTMTDIAQYYFHRYEWQAIVKAIESGDKRNALHQFYKVWSLKEAFIKAEGKGMIIPGDSFYFKEIDTSYPCIECVGSDSKFASNWYFKHQFLDSQYSMALALDACASQDQVIVAQRKLSLDAIA